ncbi:site-2 protease family protein [Luteimonas salinisoli]|nr:site-2 protease family protein [Luteimonas salinisoli]
MTTRRDGHPMAGPATLYPRIAESAAPSRPSLPARVVQFVVGAIGGVGLLWVVDILAEHHSLPTLAGLLLLVLAMLWLQVVVHEAGHAVAGLLTGRRLMGAGIGPLRLERGMGGWRLRWGGGIRGLAGFAALLPDARAESRRAAAVFILGGPLANLLAAAVALAVLAFAPSPGAAATVALGATAFGGVALGVVNLLPIRSQGWYSDGYVLRELLRDTPASRVARAQQCVLALAVAGVRPRDWPVERLEVPDGLPQEVMLTAQLMRISWALDSGDRAAAGTAAQALAAGYSDLADGQRQGVALMLATYAARNGDAPLLAAWRPLCEGGLLDLTPFRLWLDAEAAAMGDDAGSARALAAQARAAVPRIHDPASAAMMGEYLDQLEERLQDRSKRGSPPGARILDAGRSV